MESSNNGKSVIVLGAGIAGVSAAYFLSKRFGITNVKVVDPVAPGSLTSSKSTECYRNWWPEPQMLAFVNHSIDLYEELMQESGNAFDMIRGGYVFVTSEKSRLEQYKLEGIRSQQIGMGQYRLHETSDIAQSGYKRSPSTEFFKELEGIDVLTSPDIVRELFPFLVDSIVGMKHVRKCGWIRVANYIAYVKAEAEKAGVTFIEGEAIKIHASTEDNSPVSVVLKDGRTLSADYIVVSIGPALRNLHSLIDNMPAPLPLKNEIHARVIINDVNGVVPRDAPLMLYDDDVVLDWSDDQQSFLSQSEETKWMTSKIKGGVHFRPCGGKNSTELMGIWTYNIDVDDSLQPAPHPSIDDYYGEIVLRGIAKFVPRMRQYFNNATDPRSSTNKFIKEVRAGHYCKTPENRPLIGPLGEHGAQKRVILLGALSGFGIMTAPAAAELAAMYIADVARPSYAEAFCVQRYSNPDYMAQLDALARNSGHL